MGTGTTNLPQPVQEIREAILAAAASGRAEELQTVIELSEIKPLFSEGPIEGLVASVANGRGGDILAALTAILNAGWVALPIGRDLENSRVYVWPHFAETGVSDPTSAEELELARIASPDEIIEMRRVGRYTGWALGIGADGVWHFLQKVGR